MAGKVPELWNAVTGEHRFLDDYTPAGESVVVPLSFDPCGSWFVVFQKPTALQSRGGGQMGNFPEPTPFQKLSGPWTVSFDPKWGGPASAEFDELASWPTRPEPGIKFYSGTATYTKTFYLADPKPETRKPNLILDLGNVRELAEVKVNGKSCGIVWTPPFRVDVTDAVKPGANRLEIKVVNFWPNRVIGDAGLPPEQRLTRTNVRKLTKNTALMESGLLGPVTLQTVHSPAN